MKSKPVIIWLALLQAIVITATAQSFSWKRSLQTELNSGWHSFSIPVEIAAKTKPGYSDLRIFAIGPQNDTTEVPYVLENAIPFSQKEEKFFTILNKAIRDGRYYYTLEPKDGMADLNEIKLGFSEKNFDLQVTLEGSMDQQEWFVLLKDYRVTAIKNNKADFQFTTLITNISRYKFYRLNYVAPKDPVLVTAQYDISMKQNEGAWWEYKTAIEKVENLKKEKQTTCMVVLPEPLPVSLARFYIKDSIDYIRPVRIQAIPWPENSAGTDEEKLINITSGTLNSFDRQQIGFGELITRRLKIIISNNDNLPLTIDSIMLKSGKKRVITRLPEASEYIMMYGNKEMAAPQYDLAEILSKMELPDSGNITIGAEERNLPEKPKSWWESNTWLYVLMGLIIVMLGGFTMKMMRRKDL